MRNFLRGSSVQSHVLEQHYSNKSMTYEQKGCVGVLEVAFVNDGVERSGFVCEHVRGVVGERGREGRKDLVGKREADRRGLRRRSRRQLFYLTFVPWLLICKRFL